jgi:hypothetical protein
MLPSHNKETKIADGDIPCGLEANSGSLALNGADVQKPYIPDPREVASHIRPKAPIVVDRQNIPTYPIDTSPIPTLPPFPGGRQPQPTAIAIDGTTGMAALLYIEAGMDMHGL